jgi:hypothetical protein
MRGEAEFWVVPLGFRGGEEDDFRAGAELFLCETDEFATDAAVLMCFGYGEIGEVAAKGEIGDRAGDADKRFGVPGGAEQVRVLEHRFDARAIIDGPPFGEGGAFEEIDKRIGGDRAIGCVGECHGDAWPERYGVVASSVRAPAMVHAREIRPLRTS